ncbi:class I SAM-dependent methyltransferase [Nocardioides iriomotensis]|uniref:class I SAM-dependent methyltransferase n=1 Tax=Nocardioides iriomotensis TaxID=715784 RepID=UPI0013E9CC90|nr:class I SAM-dependent methyltransferase [Nocardioides iriomotensis]
MITHGLIRPALEFIESTVQPGWRTLETGSGLSTIAFAMTGSDHLVIVPNAEEEQRIRAFCADNGVDTTQVRFVIDFSERALPTLDVGEIDCYLIDGSHSFPQVFIDWFYVRTNLRVGGWLIVDDVHVWTGRVLRDFLKAEPGWEVVHQWSGRTVAFRKTAENADRDWSEQRFVERRTRAETIGRVRMAAALAREGEFTEILKRTRALLPGGQRDA